MKGLGFSMLAAGFVLAAFSTSLHVQQTDWMLFIPAALVAAAGVLLIKRASRGEARSASVLQSNRIELTESLANIVRVLDELEAAGRETSLDLKKQIDDRLRDDLHRFADARESIVHLFGIKTYASIMSEFAAGERYINRVWSASADGYDGEAADYITRAAYQFRDAQSRLQAAGQASAR